MLSFCNIVRAMDIDPRALVIYTDGSSQKNRAGGIGIRFVFPDYSGKEDLVLDIKLPGYRGVTNNEMELKAVSVALQKAVQLPEIKERRIGRIIVCSDSQFVVDNFKNACYVWPKTKWRRREGSPVLNAPLWKELVNAAKKVGVRVDFNKVEGHSSDKDNRAADELADWSSKNADKELIKGRIVRRRLTSERTTPGIVRMIGQKMKIRIIDSRFLPEQKETQLRYEIIEKKSESFGNVDLAFSELTLRPGHRYQVRFNEDNKYPQIIAVLRELKK